MKIKLYIISLLLIIFSSPGHAVCWYLDLANIPTSVDLNNDISPIINFQVERFDNSSNCRYRIGMTRGRSPSYSRKLYSSLSDLEFDLAKNASMSRTLKKLQDSNGNQNVITGIFRSNRGSNSQNKKFYAELTLPATVDSGYYTDTFYVLLYQQFGSHYYYWRNYPITFNYNVPEQINLSLVNTNAPFDIFDTNQNLNFGILNTGDTKSFDIVVQSNHGYILNVSSFNNGKLKHNQVSQTINYDFKVNGRPVSLNNSNTCPVTISNGTGGHPGDGFRIPISVEIGDVSNKLAGNYQDNLTITVTTNL